MIKLLFALLLFGSAIEIRAREAVKPASDVGQIIKDLEGVHVEEMIPRGAPCTLDIQKDLPISNLQPLYLHPNTDAYWLPNADGQLQIPSGASIELYCSHSFEIADSCEHQQQAFGSIHVRCLYDRTFEWSHEKLKLRDFTCVQPLSYSVERLQQSCGTDDGDARIYRVGYNISDGRFVHTLELCHDAEKLRTHYALYPLGPANEHFQRQVKRVKFSAAGHFAGYNMDQLYSQAYQQQRVEQLLRQSNATHSLNSNGLLKAGHHLSRGHLAARADLIYASQQRTSFNYLNAAPQWQSFNGGNWAVVEDLTRRLVARTGLSVSVYTGTYGVMSLPDAAQTSFYLATDGNNNGVLAVPSVYYRVILDKSTVPHRGLALVGVNNPHATLQKIIESYMLCQPVETQLLNAIQRWLQSEDLRKGYLYACHVADLANTVKHLPAELLEVNELLLEAE